MSVSFVSNSKLVSENLCAEAMSEPLAEPGKNGIYMGKTRIYRMPFYLDTGRLINPHLVVLGMSGSGKTYFLKSFLVRNRLHNSSRVLIIDWNGEYCDAVSFLGGKTLTLGVDACVNLFELFDSVSNRGARSVLDIISRMVKLSHEERALAYGIMMDAQKRGGTPSRINLSLILNLLHSGEPQFGSISAKLQQLSGSPLFADATSFDVGSLLCGFVSINLSNLRDDDQRGDVARAVLKIIINAMHNTKYGRSVDTIIALDEGWRLLGDSDEISILFREGRKYGFGLVIATQLAKDINNEAMANAACVLIFKLQTGEDYKLLIDAGVISEQDRRMISDLDVGNCMIRLAEKESAGRVRKFLMRKIDGVNTDFYDFVGERMNTQISGRKFAEETKKLPVNEEVKCRITDFANESDRCIELASLVRLLSRLKLERSQIVPYLKALGMDDLSIIRACESAEQSVLALV
jgi:hypothetical protein